MNRLPLYLLGIQLLLCLNISAQQVVLKGKVVNKSRQAVPFVEIALQHNDSILVKAVKTVKADSLGVFTTMAHKGRYMLFINQFCAVLFKKEISLNSDIDLGEIEINESVLLKGVEINNRKGIVEQKIDRLVYNVENSTSSQGMSGLDALRNTPLIRIQEPEGISIVGKSSVSLMINDRMVHLSGAELASYLQSLRSDDIAKIEVITTPPSKYDAKGNSGIINIVLKKNLNIGWSGTLSSSLQRNSNIGYRTGATLNYRSAKINSSLKLRQYDMTYEIKGTRNLVGAVNSIYTAEARKDNSKAVGLNYSLDYQINDRSNIGFIYDFSRANYTMDVNGTSNFERRTLVDSTLTTHALQDWKTPTYTLNAYYDLKLDTLGRKLSFTGNYLSNAPHKMNNFNTLNNTTGDNSLVRNDSRMNYNIYSLQADFTLPYTWSNMETGVKYTLLDNKSDVGYYDLIGANYIINPANSNVFKFREHNYSAYFSLQKDFTKKWSAKAGLRYEYTSLQGFTQGNDGGKVKNDYGKLFPTAYVSYKPNADHVFSLSYSKRIDRPDFVSLNPFRWYTNPYMYFTGNPTLLPAYNDNVEFSYSFKSKLTLGLYNQYSSNNITGIAGLNDGIYTYIYENAYDQNSIGLNAGYNNTFFERWETALNANASYKTTTPVIAKAEGLKVYSLYYAINNTFTLNSDKTWFLLFNFWHQLPFTYANVRMKTMLEFSPGLKASFLSKKLQMNAVVNDLFKTVKNDGYSYNAGYRSEFYQYNDQRKITLSLTYSFGNDKIKGYNKNIKFEEQRRAN